MCVDINKVQKRIEKLQSDLNFLTKLMNDTSTSAETTIVVCNRIHKNWRVIKNMMKGVENSDGSCDYDALIHSAMFD